jgi:hypothetical protein
LSWYVSDASLIIAKYLAKLKDAVKKDRGSPGVYHEMIQTWVTYELVKVIYIFRLNPSPNDDLSNFAPEIDTYIAYLRTGDEDKDNKKYATTTHELLMRQTLHTGVFHKCSFAKVEMPVWNNDVKYMIPIVILTWLRQLEEYFFQYEKETWAVLGDYLGNEKAEPKNPFRKVVLKNKSGQTYRVREYSDIKPDKTFKKKRKAVSTSLEEWAMCLLKPDLPKKLQEAIDSDDESNQRWENFSNEWKHNTALTLRMIPKDKQPMEQNTNASVEINYAGFTV